MFKTIDQRNEAIRVTLGITLCMLIGVTLDFDSTVYLALYPTIAMTKVKDYSWSGLSKTFGPTFIAACVALLICEIFQSHPFVIWTISLLFIDYMRKRADTPAKVGGCIMPIFNWVLIVIFSQFSTQSMPVRIGEILLSMLITMCVATGVVAAPTVTVGGVTIILSSEALHPASLRQLRKTFFQHVEADDTTPMVFEMKIYDRFVRKYSDYLTAVN